MMSDEQKAGPSSVHRSSFIIHRFLASDAGLRFLLAPTFVFIACCLDRNYQTDLWHHLARGKVIVEEAEVLNEDRFTYTVEGNSFQDVNWLTQVLFYRIYQLGGLELLQTFNALLLAGMMALLILLCKRNCSIWAVACGVGLFTFLGLWQFILIRPQTLSFVLFVLLYFLLEESRQRPRLLWLAPVILALWVNVHGAFPIGLVLIGCYLLAALIEAGRSALSDACVRSLVVCLAVSCLATLVNPYGWRVFEYVLLTSGTANARKIDEWLPPGLGSLAGKIWALSVVGLLILLTLPGKRLSVRQVCLLAIFFPLAVGGVRMIAWWLLLLAPIAAELIADRLPAWDWEENKPNRAAGLTCLALVVAMVLSVPALESISPFRLVRSTQRVEDDLEKIAEELESRANGGRIFTRFAWAEYFTWRLGPRFQVFMDGRIEIFPDAIWDEYSRITSGHAEWQKLLRERHVNFLVLDQGRSGENYHTRLLALVRANPDEWERVGEWGRAILFRRR